MSNLIDSILSGPTGAPLNGSPAPIRGVTIDAAGKARSEVDMSAAVAAGFAPKPTIYSRGTMVVQLGVENFRNSRQSWEATPKVGPACEDFQAKIASEKRGDVLVRASGCRMGPTGRLNLKPINSSGVEAPFVSTALTPNAFKDLCTRAGFGGGGYLADKCWPELRAANVNHQLARREDDEKAALVAVEKTAKPGQEVELPSPLELKLRTRASESGRETYAVVSPKYTAFDVDKIAAALKIAMPEDARCTVSYDGERAKFNVVFHSNVSPEDAVCGEFFKAGITFKTDDTGSGSITGYATVFQNLCLNLIIIDESKSAVIRIRHIGNVEQLAAKFKRACDSLQGRLQHFTKRWGFARKDDVVAQVRKADPELEGVPVEDIFPGLIRGLLEKEILDVKGDHESVIDAILDCHKRDDSSATTETRFSRAAVANAITRYAHEVNTDPFAEDQLQIAAGDLLFSDKPLTYVAAPARKGG